MAQRFVGFFLLFCLYGAPAYAVTIVNVSEVLIVVEQEYINECEWIESIEIRTTTTYRDVYYSNPVLPSDPVFPSNPVLLRDPVFPVHTGLTIPPVIDYSEFRHPCFPEFEDENIVVPAYCTAELQFPDIRGEGVDSGFSPGPLFREWSELSVRYDLVHHNQCDACPPTPTPEPANWILGLTGVAMVLISRRLSKGKRRSSRL